MRRAFVLGMVVVALVSGCKKHKKVVDAGVVDAGEADAGAAKDAGVVSKDAGSAPADAGGAAEAGGAVVIVSGAVERDAGGTWKLGIQLAPAPPGTAAAPPSAGTQMSVVIARAAGAPITVGLPTSFAMQGITAVGPIDVGSSGNVVATAVSVPTDATKLTFMADGRELSSIARKPVLLKTDVDAKPGRGGLELALKFEPKAPVSWIAYAEKSKGEWVQVATGDDSKVSVVIPVDSFAPGDEVNARVDSTDGFNVVTTAVKAPRPKVEAGPADAGVAAADGGR